MHSNVSLAMQSLIVLHHNAGPARNCCIQTHRVLYNAIVLHKVCALALPTYNALYNAGSAGLQQQDRVNQDVRGVAFALDTITLLPNWPEIAKISFISFFL